MAFDGPALSTHYFAGAAVPRPSPVSSLPSSNRTCGSPSSGFPRSFISPLSALPTAFAARYSALWSSRALSRMSLALWAFTNPYLHPAHGPSVAPSLGEFLLPRFHRYYGPLRLPLPSRPLHGSSPLIGSDSPSPPLGWHPKGLTAGAETGLSCSHDGCPSVPRPIRHRVLRCCISKLFAPSMAFAHGCQAQLPVGPLSGDGFTTRQASLYAADQRLALSYRKLDPARRRPGLPKRRQAATKVAWSLPWPDFHRLVIMSFQDAPSVIRWELLRTSGRHPLRMAHAAICPHPVSVGNCCDQ